MLRELGGEKDVLISIGETTHGKTCHVRDVKVFLTRTPRQRCIVTVPFGEEA